ncbi:type IV pilus assembly protein PilM [Archangium gephyra]|nr:type IV pilus assembly protein PilM [Archangium gephyra]
MGFRGTDWPSAARAGAEHFLGGPASWCYADGPSRSNDCMAKGKLALGLDIGSTSVKMILLKEQRKRGQVSYALQSFGMKPLPPEAIVDGALMNSTAIVQALQELMTELKVKNKEVAIGVSGHSVIIKKIQMPRMSQEELEESIQWEAEQYIPFDVKDVNIDTQILDAGGNDATGQMDVLLVAAKKDMINDYTTVVSESGLQPVVVDVDAFAVQNMFASNYDVPDKETVVLINAGASVVNINIISNGITVFTRDVTIGGNQFTEEIQKQLNVSYEEAEALKIGGTRGDSDAVVPQEVERVLMGVAEQVAGEIQRSLDFYAGTAVDANFTKVYLSGGTAKIPALFKTIETRVGVPVEILNPFRKIDVDNRKFDPAFIMEVAPMAAVAVGLALRKPGDKLG